ncbi:hypothetical protein GCM10007853_16640 [Algimonas ampicilliniresistens]|jgi:hypothetical protein|uniref:DUF3052 domain-containing protein n=2 Tax=Algimonas ampicilliniresistens TaxID=1298735 RepID=A0ABQ5V8P9_9PROT|nr:hypothetical protein GCM10007853_16640 [Algimonas ampicilliniresistens]
MENHSMVTGKSPPKAPAQTHGYSGKSLFQKIGLKPSMTCLTIGAPDHYSELIAGAENVAFRTRAKQADIVHLFCPDRKTLERKYDTALGKVANGGALWISWPKKSSSLYKDLTGNDLRRLILPTGWVDVKVCAVDADWSGLKFVRRKGT